ncbi:hypothetical protein [Clostridium vincentii]|uniref:Uncharacterized protein n=1 Tax=Clostridium vincentii TaxID=52704 RepID=A0A2T0BFB0_9CLOT|nr:hypothetical protein [Clostridium vincentii]PRR82507.1 hypothetical protein CLVI_16420 [Clostridium vincentii]
MGIDYSTIIMSVINLVLLVAVLVVIYKFIIFTNYAAKVYKFILEGI